MGGFRCASPLAARMFGFFFGRFHDLVGVGESRGGNGAYLTRRDRWEKWNQFMSQFLLISFDLFVPVETSRSASTRGRDRGCRGRRRRTLGCRWCLSGRGSSRRGRGGLSGGRVSGCRRSRRCPMASRCRMGSPLAGGLALFSFSHSPPFSSPGDRSTPKSLLDVLLVSENVRK